MRHAVASLLLQAGAPITYTPTKSALAPDRDSDPIGQEECRRHQASPARREQQRDQVVQPGRRRTVQSGSVRNNIRFSDSPVKRIKVDLDEHYYWVQVTDVNQTPATPETVDAVVGVGL
jgi:hypothetical protein